MLVVLALTLSQAALAYNYAGYRWGGSWPKPVVDYGGIYITDWRVRLQNTMNDWNATSANFTFRSESSNNDVLVYTENSGTLAYVRTFRQFGNWGNIVRAMMYVNAYNRFSPPFSSGYDFSTVVRHEYGHWLKLLHTEYEGLMHKNIGIGEIHYVDADAHNGIRAIYGAH